MRTWGRALAMAVAFMIAIVVIRGLPWREAENPMRIPRLLQTDYQETICVIRGEPKSVMSSGCGATCVSAVGQYLTGRSELGPDQLFEWAYDNGYYFGDGLGHECLVEMAGLFGLEAIWVKNDSDRVRFSIRNGCPVIAHMGRGAFSSTSGHYIVLIGETDQGLILVYDPYKPERGEQPYELRQLAREAKTGTSFMLISPADGATRLL